MWGKQTDFTHISNFSFKQGTLELYKKIFFKLKTTADHFMRTVL